jgi:hypothetical protein
VDTAYATSAGGDMRLYGWVFDYWDPSNMMSLLFGGDPTENPYGFESARWQAAADRAGKLTGAPRLQAFAGVARGVRRLAPWVVLDQRADPAFFSARLGCIRFPPAYLGVDLAALCLRGG